MSAIPASFFGWVAFLLQKYGSLFLRGAWITLLVAISGTICGFVIGLLVAVARSLTVPARAGFLPRAGIRALRGALAVYVEVFRGTPMIVQAMVIYYGAAQYLGLNMNELAAAVLIVSINTGAYMAEIVRGGVMSVDTGQSEAARSIGMSHWQTMASVVLPQAIRNILPSVGNEFVVNIKDSSVLNVIAVSELFFMSKSAAGTYLRYFEVFFITGIIYLILTFTVTRLLRLLERKMDGPKHFTVFGSQSDSRAEITYVKEER
ncbi:MAG: amino acid ABC transporter permease [Oscillospiraceae bacterium]|jgi:putative lysine transport system permease protein|nr:amino acid ABC transporter permease [Oscillospiraceae bacterium]